MILIQKYRAAALIGKVCSMNTSDRAYICQGIPACGKLQEVFLQLFYTTSDWTTIKHLLPSNQSVFGLD